MHARQRAGDRGCWCLCILNKYSLKTKNSERTIPLHPAIIAEGFLRYVESLNHGSRLFPAYTEHNIFKDLAAFYDRLGITKRDYYSLRRTLHTHYRFQDGIDPDVKAYLLGHGKKDAHPKYGKYSGTKLLPSVKTIRSL